MRIDVRTIQIPTPRLLLRPWMDSDLEDFFAYASIPAVGEMAGWKAHESLGAALSFLRSDWFRRECLAIYHLADKRVIGSFGMHDSWAAQDKRYNHLASIDLGFVLHPSYWGHVIAPEAAQAVIAFAFAHMDVDIITCNHFDTNTQSKRVIEKCGFTFDHEKTIHAPQLSKHFNQMHYILTK
ncbi:MAG: GNAT family N-acetyltransferase [Defluviitaleaceae bacterium]|nr:GNAT family N-acetyltransferase [Defluviitaleaceae bacterium]